MKLKYKSIAVQEQCFGDSKDDSRMWIFVKLEAQGKTRKYYKTDVVEFPNRHYLEKYLDENGLPVIEEKDFKADIVSQAVALSKASSR